ncbi:MAG: response regulator transcription factor [Cyclobacteriaceae bacterium]
MNKPNLLIVEDDPNLGEVLNEYLRMKGFSTKLCRDGIEGQNAYENQIFDLIILDIMMPRKDGLTLARELRRESEVPIIFLTARNQREDVIEGLSAGADDYLVKPFSMEELLLRIKAILRRSHNPKPAGTFNLGSFQFEPLARILSRNGEKCSLTAREADLLQMLALNLNKTTSRKEALLQIWGDDSYFNARSMDVYINKLRKHLKADKNLQIITVHGEGFKLVNLG